MQSKLYEKAVKSIAIVLLFTTYCLSLYGAFDAGARHARSEETRWILDRAHRLEEKAASDAARAQQLLQGVQAEKQTFVTSKADAGQVSSL